MKRYSTVLRKRAAWPTTETEPKLVTASAIIPEVNLIAPRMLRVCIESFRQGIKGVMMVVLAVRPPIVCEEGDVQVHVTRRPCKKTAVVEFNLDPMAQGAGCHVA